MPSVLTKFVLSRIFKESPANKEGRDDPYFEYPAAELNKAGKRRSRRQKKALPPGLTDEEGEILTKIKRRAYRLDMSFGSFLGVRFGWGSVIGIIPVIGDALDMLLALMVVRTATRLDLPTFLVIHMLFNVTLDFFIGLVPFVGDLMDAGYKCNTRNAVLVEEHLRKVGRARLKEQGITGAEDFSLPAAEDSDVDLESQAVVPHRGDRRRDQHRDDRRDGHRDDRRDGHRDDRRDGHRDDRRDGHRDDRRDDRRDHARDDDRRRPNYQSRDSGSRRSDMRADHGRHDDRDRRRDDRTHSKSRQKSSNSSDQDNSSRGTGSRR
ncbi:hypothetical protein DRE_01752 [Drechslerella stenobrocha 248]|uniref:DUF4112 domain-containing protein n=1 Tax=Drechslerella stenobrocha 248 TaxID=1043628 RepID=W7IH27_9PEZI|nr:hypothetical protein DRE_01752 [Drechslerella stenobrocha 248]